MAGKTQIGTRAITKKMFGTREITKEVVNGVVVYEKAPSGFNVTLDGTGNSATWAGSLYGFCKINSAPTAWNDYDAVWTDYHYSGSNTDVSYDINAQTSGWTRTKTLTGVNKLYCWAGYYNGQFITDTTNRVKINNVDITQRTYSNAYEITISQDTTLSVMGAYPD